MGNDLKKNTQSTLSKSVTFNGIGLHSGKNISVRLMPASVNHGILFARMDLPGCPTVYASVTSVNAEALRRRTELLSPTGACVMTTEHLLAACSGCGIDNLRVELDGPELPIFDGSALPYAQFLMEGTPFKQTAPRQWFRLKQPVSLINENSEIFAVPSNAMELSFIVQLRDKGMQNQTASLRLMPDRNTTDPSFIKTIAPARTFVFFEEIEALRQAGLIRGGSLDCAIILKDGQPHTPWRIEQELAKHKLVDLMGDLALLGSPIKAFVSARATGHAIHYEFIKKLIKEIEPDDGTDIDSSANATNGN